MCRAWAKSRPGMVFSSITLSLALTARGVKNVACRSSSLAEKSAADI